MQTKQNNSLHSVKSSDLWKINLSRVKATPQWALFLRELTHFLYKPSSHGVWAKFVGFLNWWQKWNSKHSQNSHTRSIGKNKEECGVTVSTVNLGDSEGACTLNIICCQYCQKWLSTIYVWNQIWPARPGVYLNSVWNKIKFSFIYINRN